MNSCRADVVVIGGGLAGMTAANRAAQLGRSVVVLEAGTGEHYMCNSRITMGFINAAFENIDNGSDAIRAALRRLPNATARAELVNAFADYATNALHWLRAEGVRTIVGNWRPGSAAMLYPPAAIGAGLNWRGRGADQMLQKLERNLRRRGGAVVRGCRARELILKSARCVGVRAEIEGETAEYHGEAIIIADGGFQANTELVRRHICSRPEKVLMRNARTAFGDGLQMAVAAGATTVGMEGFYGHVQSRDALANPKLWPYPTVDMPISGGILVNSAGHRIVDEGLGGVHTANVIARQPDPLVMSAIFDHRTWMTRATEFPLPANPLLVKAGATIHVAQTLYEVAAKAGIEPANLVETVETCNAAIRAGNGPSLIPPRTTRVWAPLPIAEPPFYAVPVVAGITYTTGGIAINGRSQVLTVDNVPIPGLFAAGSCTGGHEGGSFSCYTGGLGKALTFGWIAGSVVSGDPNTLTEAPPDGRFSN